METEKLIKMANQIGDFYAAFPDKEEAKVEIARHLDHFWNSVMRKSIIAHVNNCQGAGLHAMVIAAIKEHLA